MTKTVVPRLQEERLCFFSREKEKKRFTKKDMPKTGAQRPPHRFAVAEAVWGRVVPTQNVNKGVECYVSFRPPIYVPNVRRRRHIRGYPKPLNFHL